MSDAISHHTVHDTLEVTTRLARRTRRGIAAAALFALAAFVTSGLWWTHIPVLAALALILAGLGAWTAVALGGLLHGFQRDQHAVFSRTRCGVMPWAKALRMAPVIAGAALWNRWRRRGVPACNEIAPGLWLGDRTAAAQRRWTLVIDLTSEYLAPSTRESPYLCLPWMDGTRVDTRTLEEAACWIEFALQETKKLAPQVLVHCALGRWRSAQVVAYWLQTRRGLSASDAWATLVAQRPAVRTPKTL